MKVGLGKMGHPMARNLLAAGHALTVYTAALGVGGREPGERGHVPAAAGG